MGGLKGFLCVSADLRVVSEWFGRAFWGFPESFRGVSEEFQDISVHFRGFLSNFRGFKRDSEGLQSVSGVCLAGVCVGFSEFQAINEVTGIFQWAFKVVLGGS